LDHHALTADEIAHKFSQDLRRRLPGGATRLDKVVSKFLFDSQPQSNVLYNKCHDSSVPNGYTYVYPFRLEILLVRSNSYNLPGNTKFAWRTMRAEIPEKPSAFGETPLTVSIQSDMKFEPRSRKVAVADRPTA
jgi:hypothetical protein